MIRIADVQLLTIFSTCGIINDNSEKDNKTAPCCFLRKKQGVYMKKERIHVSNR